MPNPNETRNLVDEIVSALGMNAGYVVDVYSLYRENPQMVNAVWRGYFQGLERGEISPHDLPGATPGPAEAENGAPAAQEPPPPVANGAGTPAAASTASTPVGDDEELIPLRGGAALIAANMAESRSVPTATSYRTIPVKALEENRRFLNHHLALGRGGKISFTHVIAWAIIESLRKHPALNDAFVEVDGEPHRLRRPRIHLGVAVDVEKRDGSRTLLVPNLRDVQDMDFQSFLDAYNDTLARVRSGAIEPADFQGTTLSITNPGTVGTVMSAPRLMTGQGAIIAVGAIGYSAETRSMSKEMLSRLGISKQMSISCTYDHRIIQGAESGFFLGEVESLLNGDDGFYDRIYQDMGVPYHPVRSTADVKPSGLGSSGSYDEVAREARVLQLINAYRVRGHLIAHLDPLGKEPSYHPELDLETYGLTLWDLDRTFITGSFGDQSGSPWESPQATLREILETLRATYCGKIGVEYMNIQDPEQKRWLQQHLEPSAARAPFSRETKQRILLRLVGAESFERFLHTKFPGHKRFSLEGGESLIPTLDQLLEASAQVGVDEVVMGMAHRGRLNVLTQILGVPSESLFSEFQETRDPHVTQGSGDVKYHLGAQGRHVAQNQREVKLVLSPNPSHLEAVNPVVEGIARAKQERPGAQEGRWRILPVLIHGDAAFAGQGVVAETLNLSQLSGYRTGGTVHIIVNNQIGFTTPVESARSSPYPTDVAKMGQAPIFHVNGDDPEAVVRALRLAFAFRQAFQKDVVLDLVCYRRHGHNEGDEPGYTQPRLYAMIRNHPSVATMYAERLVREGSLTQEDVQATRDEVRAELDKAFDRSQHEAIRSMRPEPIETGARPGKAPVPRDTAVDASVLRRIGRVLTAPPDDVDIHTKLQKWLARRAETMEAGTGFDWALAEALAFGSLVLEGVPVRLSGQDSVRGTFSQRHLLFRDDDTDTSWMPLGTLAPDQAPFLAIDSPLSENAVLGFEFGYSLGEPSALVLWEAQFGDFVNGAQVVIDQFLCGAKAKWGQPSSLVLLLPHGYEGQGPEHSTARLERFLQLSAEDNLRVVNCTTPAQYFHVLRRQVCTGPPIPLVVMTPKSLLRHPRAVSDLTELSRARFEPVIPDPARPDPEGVRRLLLCSGKVYYDLVAAREEGGIQDVAIARIEQLHPLPEVELRQLLSVHRKAEVVWVQEEPRNMGAWTYMNERLGELEGQQVSLRYVGRARSASTATGYAAVHKREQASLVERALTG